MLTVKVNLNKLEKQLEKNLLSEDFIQSVKHSPNPRIDSIRKFYFQSVEDPKFEGLSAWECREVLAVIRHHCSKRLISILKNAMSLDEYVEKHGEDHYYYDYLLGLDERLLYDQFIKELAHLDFLEEVITFGMLGLHEESIQHCRYNAVIGKPLFGGLCYMLKHDFGKDVGIDFQKNRAEAVKAELEAYEVSASEFWSTFLGES